MNDTASAEPHKEKSGDTNEKTTQAHSPNKPEFIEKIIDFIFSNDERKWLVPIFFLAVLLRFLAVSHIQPVPDEMVHGTHAIGIVSLNPLSTMTQSPLWFYLTDVAYKFFGITLFSARFLSFFFGALSVLLVYLIAKQLFNKKIAIIASFLLAISSYHITWASIYMDEAMMFFVLFACYFFIKEYKEKNDISLLSAVSLGIGVLMKIIAGVFAVVFAGFIILLVYKSYQHDKKLSYRYMKKGIIFCFIILLLFIPVIAYNYFLYQEKKLVDLPFAMYFGINTEFYQGSGLAHGKGFLWDQFFSYMATALKSYLLKMDPLIFLLGLLGVILSFKKLKENKFLYGFLLALVIFPLCFLAISILLPTHYTSFMPFFAIYAAVAIYSLDGWFKKIKFEKAIAILLLVITATNIFLLYDSLTSESAMGKMRKFASSAIDDNTLVIVDSRIYRGSIAWMFNDKHYIESSIFPALLQAAKNFSQGEVPTHTFFIECVPDDCGWGTIKDQPEFNNSVEEMVSFFANSQAKKQDIFGGGGRGEYPNQHYFRIYEISLMLPEATVKATESTHEFFFYPVRRDRIPQQAFDYYTVNGGFNRLLNLIAYIILYASIAIAVLSVLFLFYLLYKDG